MYHYVVEAKKSVHAHDVLWTVKREEYKTCYAAHYAAHQLKQSKEYDAVEVTPNIELAPTI
jgi:hypothetical protein